MPSRNILVINCGSSSIKFALINEAQPHFTLSGLAERLVAPLLQRTQQLVDDGVVGDAELADAGVIFGTGFAPFTGGPLNYARSRHA